MFFGTKSHYTILSNYVTIFEVDAEMSEIFTDFQGKNPRKILPIDFNYWYLRFSPKLVMFLQGGWTAAMACFFAQTEQQNIVLRFILESFGQWIFDLSVPKI